MNVLECVKIVSEKTIESGVVHDSGCQENVECWSKWDRECNRVRVLKKYDENVQGIPWRVSGG